MKNCHVSSLPREKYVIHCTVSPFTGAARSWGTTGKFTLVCFFPNVYAFNGVGVYLMSAELRTVSKFSLVIDKKCP